MTVLHPLKEQLVAAGRVAVLAGGKSSEREISLQSGRAVLAGLRELGVDAQLVDPIDLAADTLKGFDRIFLALHGPGGEDGTMQGYLECLGLPYTGSDVLSSAICMDKLRCKWLWQGAGLSTPDFYLVGEGHRDLGFPVMVKPANEGSSIGMSRVDDEPSLALAIDKARQYDRDVLVERYIKGAEFTVAILGNEVLPPIRLETDNRFYDFNAKYESNDTRYLCPCGLPPEQEVELRDLAMRAFRLLGCRHWGRVDVMQDAAGRFYLLEVNTLPGMTSHSLVPMAAKAVGMSFPELAGRILLASMTGGD
jgi:D-alanine-D-alanine ligase